MKADVAEEMRQETRRRGGRVLRALAELEEALKDMHVGDTGTKTRNQCFRLLDHLEGVDRGGIPCL